MITETKTNEVEVLRLRNYPLDWELPSLATGGSSGFDLRSVIYIEIDPGEILLIPTGLAIAMPQGMECQIRPRSGLAVRNGITVLNSPGTVDSDYRGELKVILMNLGGEKFVVQEGDRIAQAVFSFVPSVQLKEVNELSRTERGAAGFGSTGS